MSFYRSGDRMPEWHGIDQHAPKKETHEERHIRIRKEYGDYVQRRHEYIYGTGRRRWSAEASRPHHFNDQPFPDVAAFQPVVINTQPRRRSSVAYVKPIYNVAAVSSASSTTSEVSGSENFFSITEDDTPQNSPLRKTQTLSSNSTSTPVQPAQSQNQLNNINSSNSAVETTSSNNLTTTASNNNSSSSSSLAALSTSFFSNFASGNAAAANMLSNSSSSNNNNNGSSISGVSPTVSRVRRLSNSSMASDVSFRLPSYDSPAVSGVNKIHNLSRLRRGRLG